MSIHSYSQALRGGLSVHHCLPLLQVRFRVANFPHLVAHLEHAPVFHSILHDSKALEVNQGETVALR